MSLIRWQPLRDLDTLRQQMNRLFDELTQGNPEYDQSLKLSNRLGAPAIELRETDTNLVLKAIVPGMKAEELDVQASENAVSIAGEHREEKRTEEKGYFHSELQYGQFQRTVPLPVAIKHDQIQAEFKDGVLTLILPKAEPARQNVTKIAIATPEKARESVVHQRQHEEHLQETMRTRAAAEIKTPSSAGTQAEARELMVEQRQRDEHLQETMHQRAVEDIDSTIAH